jgi:hypothetical protein
MLQFVCALRSRAALPSTVSLFLVVLLFVLQSIPEASAQFLPQPIPGAKIDPVSNLVPDIGISIAPLDDNRRARYNIPSHITTGVVITAVAPNTDAERKLIPGDVILQVGAIEVRSSEDVVRLFRAFRMPPLKSDDVGLRIFSLSESRLVYPRVAFLTKDQAEVSDRYLKSAAEQLLRPRTPSPQASAPVSTFLCEALVLAECDRLLALPLAPEVRARVLEAQRKAISYSTPDFEGRLAACRTGNKSQCEQLHLHALAKHRLADIREAERSRVEHEQQAQKRRDEYPANLAACERYDLDACHRISVRLLFVPGTGITDKLDEATKTATRFNAALQKANSFQSYLRDCAAKNRMACDKAQAMPNLTPAHHSHIAELRRALPIFDIDDPNHFMMAIIVIPIVGFLLFVILAQRSPASSAQHGPEFHPRTNFPASTGPQLGFRSRLARMIDPSIESANIQAAAKAQVLRAQSTAKREAVRTPSAPLDPETAQKALALAYSFLSEIPDTIASDVMQNPDIARECRNTLALAARQLDIAQRADPSQKLSVEDEDGLPRTILQERLRARTIQLEALTWGGENPRREIELLAQATEVDPTMVAAFQCLGAAHLQSRNRAAAIAALETAITLEPDNIDVMKLLERARNMSDAEIATYKFSNAAAKTASVGIKTWHGMKLAGAVAVFLIPLFAIASFTGSMGKAFLILLVGPPFLWLYSRVMKLIHR